MRTTLESGAHIEHVPVQDLKGKHIRAMDRVAKMRMSRDDVDSDGEVDVGGLIERMDLADMDQARHDALWALLITSWSYDFPVPVLDHASGIVSGAEVLDEIPAGDYAEIDEVLDPHLKKLRRRPNRSKVTTSASNGSSPAKASASRRG
jgi:hypothetical protein